MASSLKQIPWICAILAAVVSAQAAGPVSYQIGEKAREDIVATTPFDVVDDGATAALKASRAHGIAAIYRRWDGITNVVAREFLTAFADAHSSFSNAMIATYHQPVIDEGMIGASDFGYFLTAYNVEHKSFPLTTELAVAWAEGQSGAAFRDKWLGLLLQTMSGPVEPDVLPPHFLYQKKIRIMPVRSRDEQFTFFEAWRRGYVISADKVPAISLVRRQFRRQFSEDAQPLAGALARLLQPNCLPEAQLTKEARDESVRQIVVADHFDSGQIIVHRGEMIDARTKAELDAMNRELAVEDWSRQAAADHERARQAQEQLEQEHSAKQLAQLQAQSEQTAAELSQQHQQQALADRARAESLAREEHAQAEAMEAQAVSAQSLAARIRARNEWLIAALASVSTAALLLLWGFLRRRRPATVSAPAKLQRVEKYPPGVPAELAPFLAQTLKEALVQGLAAQRAELLEAQRQAAAEIAELVNRLDQLHAPMQERLRAYQERIQELQKELAERTEENRELLKLKIEMMRRHIEMERGRVKFN